jgi:hypothetical protein
MAVNLFDANFYRANNPDLAGFDDAQALQHLLEFGLNEGRMFSPFVDLDIYQANNPDLGAAGLTTNRQLYDHLSTFGAAEGRTFSLVFNINFYQAANADLQAAGLNNEQLVEHFQNFGINEGRPSSVAFDPNFYRAVNPDLQTAGLNNEQLIEHFQNFGINEGRQASQSFNVSFYISANPDLQAAGFNFQQALQHYLSNGIAEGRTGTAGATAVTTPVETATTPVEDTATTPVEDTATTPVETVTPPVEDTATTPVEDTVTPVDEAGNTASTARDLGVLSERITFEGYIDTEDPIDVYQFEVPNTIDFNYDSNLEGDGRLLRIYEAGTDFFRGGAIASGRSSFTPGSESSSARVVSPGTYLLEVELSPFVNLEPTNYQIQLINETSEMIDLEVGETVNGFVGPNDYYDYYYFYWDDGDDGGPDDRAHLLKIELDGIDINRFDSDTPPLYIYEDVNENRVADDSVLDLAALKQTDGSFAGTFLPDGYYVLVVKSDGNDNNYTLRVSPTPWTSGSTSSQSSDSINLSSDANAAEFDALTGINNTSEIPSGADFNNPGLDTPTVSLIEDFSGSNALESGGLASNPVSSPSVNLLAAESLAGDPNFADIFPDNGLGNSNLITL